MIDEWWMMNDLDLLHDKMNDEWVIKIYWRWMIKIHCVMDEEMDDQYLLCDQDLLNDQDSLCDEWWMMNDKIFIAMWMKMMNDCAMNHIWIYCIIYCVMNDQWLIDEYLDYCVMQDLLCNDECDGWMI